jgi:hypothetical protein
MGRSRKDPYSPHGGNFCRPGGGGGEKKLLLIIVNVLGHPKGVGGLTSYFLRGGGMDVFWNDPIALYYFFFIILCQWEIA